MDSIEREVEINAPIDRVWGLVTEPGWWIGDGGADEQQRRQEGELHIVEHAKYGTFALKIEKTDPRKYISYRWIGGYPDPDGDSTLVEFSLQEREGGTLLKVVESGFDSLNKTPDERKQAVEGNYEGWKFQLNVAKERAEQG
ncbi:SRPBCC domain-containing protein [Amycolatopsis sp. NPDC059657]|uniref:SRPBCC domain-containing protein n=1 Tax=Amycolatopsis sp. NPDC059657 TaxID=3346899 RepID=UPI00366C7732